MVQTESAQHESQCTGYLHEIEANAFSKGPRAMIGVAIRVDASTEIGTGHLMRCVTLANELAESGASVTFVARTMANQLADMVRANGHAIELLLASRSEDAGNIAGEVRIPHAHWLPVHWSVDARDTAALLRRRGPVDWLIVDHYALDNQWESWLRPYASRLLAIDDLADRRHDCDFLLDQNLVEGLEERYDALVPSSCKTLLGPAHALLRPQFVAARSHLRERDGEIRRIFVFMGGGDPMNETGKVLSALADLEDCDLAVDVVMGGACPHVDLIRRQAASMQRVCVHHQTTDMASLMAIADLAVGSGGTASWERCCLGLPTVAVAIADNQFGALQQLDRVGAIRYLGEFNEVVSEDYLSALQHLLADRRQVQTMSAAAMRIVDGKGCQRVRAALMESERALNGAV